MYEFSVLCKYFQTHWIYLFKLTTKITLFIVKNEVSYKNWFKNLILCLSEKYVIEKMGFPVKLFSAILHSEIWEIVSLDKM